MEISKQSFIGKGYCEFNNGETPSNDILGFILLESFCGWMKIIFRKMNLGFWKLLIISFLIPIILICLILGHTNNDLGFVLFMICCYWMVGNLITLVTKIWYILGMYVEITDKKSEPISEFDLK